MTDEKRVGLERLHGDPATPALGAGPRRAGRGARDRAAAARRTRERGERSGRVGVDIARQELGDERLLRPAQLEGRAIQAPRVLGGDAHK